MVEINVLWPLVAKSIIIIHHLTGVNLKGAVLEGSNMAGVNLRVATLKNANLQNCDLRAAVLAGADLEVTSFAFFYNSFITNIVTNFDIETNPLYIM